MGASTSRSWRAAGLTLLGVTALLASRAAMAASCADLPGGPASLAAVRAEVADQCNCATSISHGAFVRCAKHVIDRAIALEGLSSTCASEAKRCASRSTCGRAPSAVTCCRTTSSGKTVCSVKTDPSKCRAPAGGSVCTGVFTSCCDACGMGGCAPSYTPTATPTATITDTPTITMTPTITPTITQTPTFPAICQSNGVPLPPLAQVPFTIQPGTSECGGAGLANPDPAAPFSGAVANGSAATVDSLGVGCLYTGFLPGLRLPDGAQSKLDVVSINLLPPGVTLAGSAGTGPHDCTKGAGPGRACVNGAAGFDGHGTCEFDDDCDGIVGACALTANCFFGPPVPLVASGLPTCIVNAFLTDMCGNVQLLPPTSTLAAALESRIYVTGNADSPCPRCEAGVCNSGDNAGGACTAVGTGGTSIDCPPQLSTFLASLRVVLPSLTTGTSTMTSSDGFFCPGQTVQGAFGISDVRSITEVGVAPGGSTNALEMTLAGTFCVPSAGPLLDFVAKLPGPGALSAKGTIDLSGVLP